MSRRRKMVPVDFTLLACTAFQRQNASAEVAVTLMSNDRVNVSSATTPIALKLADFNLEGGREKLQEAANVVILPRGHRQLRFRVRPLQPRHTPRACRMRWRPPRPAPRRRWKPRGPDGPGSLRRAFRDPVAHGQHLLSGPAAPGSDAKSIPLLDNIHDIVNRCPDLDIEIGGHTDSDGSAATNQRPQRTPGRRRSADYLRAKGHCSEPDAALWAMAKPARSAPMTRAKTRRATAGSNSPW